MRHPRQREHAIDLILDRYPTLAAMGRPDIKHATAMRAYCSIVTILDPSAAAFREMAPRRDDDWGFLKLSGAVESGP